MATDRSFIDYVAEVVGLGARLTHRKMFGEYALYYDNKVVALICDDRLYVKPSSASEPFISECEEAPPYPGAKNYLLVPEDKWEDREWLQAFLVATAQAVPKPKPKKQKPG